MTALEALAQLGTMPPHCRRAIPALILILAGCSNTSTTGDDDAVRGTQGGSAGSVSVAGSPNTGGIAAMGGSATGPAGGTTSAQAGAHTSIGGATSGQAGAHTSTGGEPTAQAGMTAGQGGASSGIGGASTRVGGSGSPPVAANAIYAAPNGASNAAGTVDNPTTLANAV